jgi:hypothetical protein
MLHSKKRSKVAWALCTYHCTGNIVVHKVRLVVRESISRCGLLSIFSQYRHVDVDVAWAQVQVYYTNDNEGARVAHFGHNNIVHVLYDYVAANL